MLHSQKNPNRKSKIPITFTNDNNKQRRKISACYMCIAIISTSTSWNENNVTVDSFLLFHFHLSVLPYHLVNNFFFDFFKNICLQLQPILPWSRRNIENTNNKNVFINFYWPEWALSFILFFLQLDVTKIISFIYFHYILFYLLQKSHC